VPELPPPGDAPPVGSPPPPEPDPPEPVDPVEPDPLVPEPPGLTEPPGAALEPLLVEVPVGGADATAVAVELVVCAVEVEVVAGGGAPDVGTVSGGVLEVSATEDPPPPHAATAPPHTQAAASATTILTGRGRPRISSRPQEPSGSIRLPHTGQSFRSFWAS
jgi:hypothetical protein